MKNNTNTTLLAAAALAGLFAGSLPTTAGAAITTTKGQTLVSPGTLSDGPKGETHSCKGHNSCKGKGGCKTGDAGCAGKNSCKGKGGCAMKDGKPAK